jgi:hypothetical protein
VRLPHHAHERARERKRLGLFLYELAAGGADGASILATRFRKLKSGRQDLARSYEVVILDPPLPLQPIEIIVTSAQDAASNLDFPALG